MNLFKLIDEVTELTDSFVGSNMEMVPANSLGLDIRCGKVFVSPDCIAIHKANDRAVQYYGGFEYVDKEFRHEMGDFVFYSAEDGRIQGHLETYLNKEEENV
jgi:hypothetical protein